jgi:hypothetical protein
VDRNISFLITITSFRHVVLLFVTTMSYIHTHMLSKYYISSITGISILANTLYEVYQKVRITSLAKGMREEAKVPLHKSAK